MMEDTVSSALMDESAPALASATKQMISQMIHPHLKDKFLCVSLFHDLETNFGVKDQYKSVD